MMLKEKRVDLDGERQKRLLFRLVSELGQADPGLYYRPTNEIARRLEKQIASNISNLSSDDRSVLARLSWRDIQVLLSLN